MPFLKSTDETREDEPLRTCDHWWSVGEILRSPEMIQMIPWARDLMAAGTSSA